eukprot:5106388-Pleurochrysis_carterae.AAC.1
MHKHRPRLLHVLQGSCQIQQRRRAAVVHSIHLTTRPPVFIGHVFAHSSAKPSSEAGPEPRVDAQCDRGIARPSCPSHTNCALTCTLVACPRCAVQRDDGATAACAALGAVAARPALPRAA